jgi:hypothetical protein
MGGNEIREKKETGAQATNATPDPLKTLVWNFYFYFCYFIPFPNTSLDLRAFPLLFFPSFAPSPSPQSIPFLPPQYLVLSHLHFRKYSPPLSILKCRNPYWSRAARATLAATLCSSCSSPVATWPPLTTSITPPRSQSLVSGTLPASLPSISLSTRFIPFFVKLLQVKCLPGQVKFLRFASRCNSHVYEQILFAKQSLFPFEFNTVILIECSKRNNNFFQ